MIKIQIITSNGFFLEREMSSITLPTDRGAMEVLPGHASIVLELEDQGKLHLDNRGLIIEKGIAHIENDKVLILSDKVIGV